MAALIFPSLILASLIAPLLLAGLLGFPPGRALVTRLAPWAPLPALILALAAPAPVALDLPWLLLGTRLGLDDAGRVFLLFTALIWLAAGWFARVWLALDPRRHVFAGFFLLTQLGNLGVCLAPGAVGFYFFFALMSFAAYGLVVHDGSAASRRAGRVYLALAVAGEMLILAGLMLLVASNARAFPAAMPATLPAAMLCLFLGFGVKTGLPLFHVSLPLAYSAAPIPGAAVLAGAMINAGVLGWLRFLPLGELALPALGSAVMLVGLLAIFFGAAVGLTQRNTGALLAYSSISQIGYFTVAIGAGLLAPVLWPLLAPALVLYAAHHGLAKAAMFLGLGVAQQRGATPAVLLGLALPALALAGAPLTSGMLAKSGLKQALEGLPAPWSDLLPVLLALGALGTSLLMLRLFWLVRRETEHREARPGLLAPWLLTLLAVAGSAALLTPAPAWLGGLTADALLTATWPIVAAVALALAAVRLRLHAPQIPPGDLLVSLERVLSALGGRLRQLPPLALSPMLPRTAMRSPRLEYRLRGWSLAGLLWLLVLGIMAAGLVI